VRAKNVRNILLHNIVDKLICAVCYWALGFAFAYGDSKAGLIGCARRRRSPAACEPQAAEVAGARPRLASRGGDAGADGAKRAADLKP